jgi:hypothetical protein
MFFGIILIIVGLVFLLENMGIIEEPAWNIIWPSLLIIWGISMIFKRTSYKYWWGYKHKEDVNK